MGAVVPFTAAGEPIGTPAAPAGSAAALKTVEPMATKASPNTEEDVL